MEKIPAQPIQSNLAFHAAMPEQRAPTKKKPMISEPTPPPPAPGDDDETYDRLNANQVEAQFRMLFQEVVANSPTTVGEYAARLGINTRKFQRLLYGQTPLSIQMLVAIGNALELDKTRAVIAIERFADWRAYYDPTVIVAVDLIKPVVDLLNSVPNALMEPLHPKATQQLAKWIVDTVLEHQAKVWQRRQDLELRNS